MNQSRLTISSKIVIGLTALFAAIYMIGFGMYVQSQSSDKKAQNNQQSDQIKTPVTAPESTTGAPVNQDATVQTQQQSPEPEKAKQSNKKSEENEQEDD